MPLQKRVIAVPFQGGVDTKTDPKQVIPGKLIDLQNGIFQQTGALNRRWGYKALGQGVIGSTATIAACKAVEARFNSELMLYDGQNAFSYIAADNAWASRGEVISVIQTNQQVVRNSSQQLSPDTAQLSGIQVTAWEDSRGGIRYTIIDVASGAVITADRPLYVGMPSTLVRPKTIAIAAIGIIAIFHVMADGTIAYVPINPSNPTAITAPLTIIVGQGASAPGSGVLYDVAADTNGVVYMNYSFNTGGNSGVTLVAMGGNPLTVTNIIQGEQVGGGIALCSPVVYLDASRNVWAAWPNAGTGSTNVSVVAFHPGGLGGLFSITQIIQQATGPLASISVVVNGTTATVFAEAVGSQPNNQVVYNNTITTSGVLGTPAASAPVFVRSVGLASKAFTYGSNIFVNVAYQSQQQSTYFTMDGAGNVVAKAIAQLGGGLVSSNDYVLSECQQVSPGIFEYANLVKGIVNTEAGAVQSLLGVNLTKLDFFDSNSFLSASINGALYTVGGILQSYDGAQYVEHGFHVYPEAAVFTPSASGGLMLTGVYDYAITYEWVDNAGNTQISTPSIVQSVNVTGPTGSVQITIPTLRLTKKSNVRIVVYRTVAGPGAILYRVTSALLPTYNNPAVDTISFTDTLADTSITSNGVMYTQPLTVGANPVLPNAAPPACSLLATFANRLFIAGLDNPYQIWYSQTAIQGSPMQFSASLVLQVDPDGGPITALARMDDKLVIFKKNAIFYITGQGPTATGDQNDFGLPIQVPSGAVGCASQNSIVSTPIGLLFQSLNGIYLLDRGLNVSYKGAPVEGYGVGSLTITSATLVPNQWVIFTTTTGLAFVYDYYYDQWSTFTNHAAVDSDLYLGAGDLFVWANAAGQVFQQTPNAFSDNGAPIKFRALTAKLNPGVLQGYQRVYHAFLLGTYKGSHSLNVACLFDYDDTATAMTLIPADATLGTGVTFGSASPFGIDSPFGGVSSGQTVYQFRMDILRKCQSIQFDITDLESSPGNEGFSLSALTLVVGVKQGAFKVPAIKQFGVN